MKFEGQGIQNLDPEQDKQTNRHTYARHRTHYYAICAGGNK